MIARHLIFLALFTSCTAGAQQLSPVQTNGSLVHFGDNWVLHSKTLHEDRPCWIYLPSSYQPTPDQAPQKYPVLYVLDGQSHFQWASQVVQFLGDTLEIPDLIVVAVPNVNRNRDLTPTHNAVIASSGGGDSFEKFLAEELAPAIDAQFRTAPYRILVGHSLGGVIVADVLLRRGNDFQSGIAIDPSLFWDDEVIVRRAQDFHPKADSTHNAIFIATANHAPSLVEPTNTVTIKSSSERFVSILKTNAPGIRIGYHFFENESHGSSRLLGLYNGLRFIFEDYQPTNVLAIDDPSLIQAHFKSVSERLGFEILPPERYVNMIASALLSANHTDLAIECFDLNVTNYPGAAEVYSRLADAYSKKGETNLAVQNLKKALELNPDRADDRNALEKYSKAN